MNLMFNLTEDFENDLQKFDEATCAKITERVNLVAQEWMNDKKAFARHARRPCAVKFGNGYESSLYAVRVDPNVRLLLTIEDDPIFDQIIVTLMRVVGRAELRESYNTVSEALYCNLNGRPMEVGVLVG